MMPMPAETLRHSTSQINQMLASRGVVDADALARFKYSRFAAVLINMLLLIITLPFFLLREPANLLLQSLWCAAVAVPGMIAALIGLTVELPGIPPAAGVFLPVAILIPIALAVARPTTAETLQFKGPVRDIRPLSAEDKVEIEEYRESFVQELAGIGYNREMANGVVAGAEDAVAVVFEPVAIFNQTPGPKAGTKIEAHP